MSHVKRSRSVGTYLYGRRMYETMRYWETAHTVAGRRPVSLDFAQIWQAADKIVYSATLQAPDRATRMIFAAAGIRAGMRVLDLGCGAGDVAFVAADLVGPEGYVTGVDRSPEALGRARLRAEQRGLTQVEFIEGDIHDPAPGGPFDAIVSRLILMYAPDPAAVLRRQATVLRAGGLVVPIELDIPTGRALPTIPALSPAAWPGSFAPPRR